MGDQNEDKGHSRQTTEAKEPSPRRYPMVTKRTPRMVHESSFATAAFTSSRSQKRPPGFIASSLDFKSNAVSAAVGPNAVTTKPGRNKNNNNKQQQEQLEREKQYQEQRQYRPGHPTRAQGNFGPPAHAVKSLEDLENMSEEQIYKLFMDDPDLHQAFIKATGKEEYNENDAPTSAPAGAKKGRRSAGRKPSNSSKSKRSSTKTKVLKSKNVEREVPYFQWLFVFILVGVAIYKICKAYSIPATTKDSNGITKNATKGKRKKKNGGKPVKKTPTKKIIVEIRVKPNLPVEDKEAAENKSSSKRKRKKKTLKVRSTIISSEISDVDKENNQTQKRDQQHKLNLDSTDGSSGNNEPEKAKLDLVIQTENDLASSPTTEKNEEAWQTVTKSSKVDKKGKTIIDPNLVEEKNMLNQLVVENMGDGAVIFEPKKEPIKHPVEQSMEESDFIVKKQKSKKKQGKATSSNDEKGNIDVAQPITEVISGAGHVVEENEIVGEIKHLEKSDVDSNGKSATLAEDDAALALQLHKEEINLARVANGNPQEEAWEEVTSKKKRG